MATSTHSIHPDKAAIRERVLAARNELGEIARREASRRIVERLLGRREFQDASGVHCFVSLPEEVNTDAIFEACWNMGKETYVPYLMRDKGALGWASRKRGDVLAASASKVLEPGPANRAPVPLEAIDLLVVPGTAFDRAGNRMGYGKGYYDKFIDQIAKNHIPNSRQARGQPGDFPPRIGLAFSVQIIDSVPQDPWDKKMHVILTELDEIQPEAPF